MSDLLLSWHRDLPMVAVLVYTAVILAVLVLTADFDPDEEDDE